jgi:hypothetical protein
VLEREDVVTAVAVLTVWSIMVACLDMLAVSAGPIRGQGTVVVFVTLAAVDRFQACIVRVVLYAIEVDVAVDAAQIGVDACGEEAGIDG